MLNMPLSAYNTRTGDSNAPVQTKGTEKERHVRTVSFQSPVRSPRSSPHFQEATDSLKSLQGELRLTAEFGDAKKQGSPVRFDDRGDFHICCRSNMSRIFKSWIHVHDKDKQTWQRVVRFKFQLGRLKFKRML